MKKCPQVRIFFKKEENVGKKLLNTDFLDFIPKAQTTKEKINQWDYTKLKIFCIAKDIINKRATYEIENSICKPRISSGVNI